MGLWSDVVDVLREAIFAYAQMSNGNLACGIMAVTFLARLALLPLTLRLARRAARQQEAMRRLKPELDAARAAFRDDPARLANETQRIFAREGLSMIPAAGCLGIIMQTPVLLALYNAVRESTTLGGRFLWIRDISKPDMALAMVVAAITAASMAAGPQPDGPAQQRMVMLALPAVFTLVALWQMASGVGLYWGVSSLVGVAQGLIVRHALVRQAA
ncbi:MAG TPA: YidC/Oxa1 family membrane protein insertase [Vicinamibacterales bacterium]|nr:YidC/Oxa1 family membrane protein insertase [Vicinamibacterales bacterium]